MFLPDEIINLIFSFREINPVALLLRKSIKDYNNSVYDSYYKHALIKNQERIYLNGAHKLTKYRDDRIESMKNKKLVKKNRINRNNKQWDTYFKKREEYDSNFMKYHSKFIIPY